MIDSNDIFGDFETRSAAKLTGKDSVGAWRYSIDKSTSPICLSYAFGMSEPELWVQGQPQPKRLREAILDGARFHGWNSMSFERAIFMNQMYTKLGWVQPKLDQYYDTMSDALTLALPGSLDECGKALGITNLKDSKGKKLITKLCTPISSGSKQGLFRTFDEFRNDYIDLFLYCKQDVRAEREIYTALPYHVTGDERKLQLLIAVINERGIPIDIHSVQAIAEALEFEMDAIADRFHSITGLDSPTQREKFKDWLVSNKCHTPNMQEDTLSDIINNWQISDNVRKALILYASASKTSTAKYFKLQDMICPDDRIRNNLIYNKANTGRLAGSGFQGQNLPRETLKNPMFWINQFHDRNIEGIRLWSSVHDVASMLLRSMIKATVGNKLIAGDLKGVEARGGSWTAMEWAMLENFRKGLDQYRVSASGMYAVAYELVNDEQRQAGKVAVLSGQFGGGWRALIRMGKKYGVHFTEKQAKQIVRDFRKARKSLVDSWGYFEIAAHRAMSYPGGLFYVDKTKRFSFVYEGRFLYMFLPSGRRLAFPFPRMEEVEYFGRVKTELTAMWVDSSPTGNHRWERRSLRGPNLFQSGVQASCRDFITDGHMAVEDAGYPLILSVHDEGLSEVPDDPRFSVQEYNRLMTILPSWAQDFPLESDCWEGPRYKK